MNITQIIPSSDWFFVGDCHGADMVYPLAAWAMTAEGGIIGLIAEEIAPNEEVQTPKLVLPPDFPGAYVHLKNLSDTQRIVAGIPEPQVD